MSSTLWCRSSAGDRVSAGFDLIEQRRWQGVLDLWDPWEAGPASVSAVGRLHLLVARVHLAVEESPRHVGPALDALDEILDPMAGADHVTAAVLRPSAVALAVTWADELWGPAALAVAGGREPACVEALLARARALCRAGAQPS